MSDTPQYEIPRIAISLSMTLTDGSSQEISSTHGFTNDDEAEDMYWAILGAIAGSSNEERNNKRGKGSKR